MVSRKVRGHTLSKKNMPEIVLPELDDGGPEDFDELAKSYLTSADLLWQSEQEQHFKRLIAPTAMCLGLGLELFLKARLIERKYTHTSLRTDLGHDIFRMWMMPELNEMRRHAQSYAIACAEDNKSPIPDPSKFTVDWNVEYLSRLYGRETFSALRYPKGRTQVCTKIVTVPPAGAWNTIVSGVHAVALA